MIDTLLRQFFVKRRISPCRILAAVSGGPDSTALLLALADLRIDGFDIVCGHVNHRLRGGDSDADEMFVRELCAHLGIEFHAADGALDRERVRQRGIEAAAREIRYARLAALRVQTGAQWVATAHQQNDQAETVLMRLVTGSGIAGLRGIHPVRDDGFIRPLLEASRAEVEAFLRERGVVARVDLSNDDPRFLRNRIRIIVRELGAVASLAAVAAQAQQQWPILERAIDDVERSCAIIGREETRFVRWPEERWLRQALLHRHVRRLDAEAREVSSRDLERIADEVEQVRRLSVTKRLELVRDGSDVVLRRMREPAGAFEAELTADSPLFLPKIGITLLLSRVVDASATSARLPREAARNGQMFALPHGAAPDLIVRSRRAGDRFQPLGLQSPKKLKDFLIDRKIAADARERIPLLVWRDEIVCVAGVEVSERFKVTGPDGDCYAVWMEDSRAADADRDHGTRQL